MKILFKLITIKICRIISEGISSFLPLKKNQILAYSFAGKQYSDSPKYITDFIISNNPGEYTILWAVSDPKQYRVFENEYIKFIKYKSVTFAIKYMESKFIITNMGPIRAISRRRGQEIINTWHGGGAYKNVGTESLYESRMQKRYNSIAMHDVTLFLSSSEMFTRVCINNAHHYKGKVLNVGLPRNDLLICKVNHDAIKKRVKNYYGIEEDKNLVLYAPTWRNYDMNDFEAIDFKKLLASLKSRFGGEWALLFRAHNKMIETEKDSNNTCIHDVTNYPDMQELLITADALISDYSSTIWDFSLLNKPGFLYVPDLEKYEKQFGFCTPIQKWGYKFSKTNEGLERMIEKYNHSLQIMMIEENHRYFHNYETGCACEYVRNYIKDTQK